jgi:GNAT superfamily N-acetyltransferase
MEETITVCLPKDLSEADLAACLQVLKEGDAVDLEFAAAELPRALRVVVVRAESVVIGVAAIKRPRPNYAAGIAKKSTFAFASDMPELGYAAVRKAYQGHNLGGRLVQEILASYGKKPLFATDRAPRDEEAFGAGRIRELW